MRGLNLPKGMLESFPQFAPTRDPTSMRLLSTSELDAVLLLKLEIEQRGFALPATKQSEKVEHGQVPLSHLFDLGIVLVPSLHAYTPTRSQPSQSNTSL